MQDQQSQVFDNKLTNTSQEPIYMKTEEEV